MKTRVSSLLLLALVLVTAACTSSSGGSKDTAGGTAAAPSTGAATSAPTSPSASAPASTSAAPASLSSAPAQTVRVTSLLSDGETYGIGMPIVLFFSPMPTDSAAFTKAVKVTADGQPVDGAWYWSQPTADEVRSHTIEAHFRPQSYWSPDTK